MKVNKPTGESQLTVTGLVLKFILKESALQNRAVNNPIKIILEQPLLYDTLIQLSDKTIPLFFALRKEQGNGFNQIANTITYLIKKLV